MIVFALLLVCAAASDLSERRALLEGNLELLREIGDLQAIKEPSLVSTPNLRRALLEDAALAAPKEQARLPLCDGAAEKEKYPDYCELAEEMAQSPNDLSSCYFCSVSHRFLGTSEAYDDSYALFQSIMKEASKDQQGRSRKRKGKRQSAFMSVIAPYVGQALDFTNSNLIPARALPYWYMMRQGCVLADKSACANFVERIRKFSELDADNSDSISLSEYLSHLSGEYDPRFWGFLGKAFQESAAGGPVSTCKGVKDRGMWGGGSSPSRSYPHHPPPELANDMQKKTMKSLNLHKFKARLAGPMNGMTYDCAQRLQRPFSTAVYKDILSDVYNPGDASHNCKDGGYVVTCGIKLNQFMVHAADILATCGTVKPDAAVWESFIDKYVVDDESDEQKRAVAQKCSAKTEINRMTNVFEWLTQDLSDVLQEKVMGSRGPREMQIAFQPMYAFLKSVYRPDACNKIKVYEGRQEEHDCLENIKKEGGACTGFKRNHGSCRIARRECRDLKSSVERCRKRVDKIPSESDLRAVNDEIEAKYGGRHKSPASPKPSAPSPEPEEEGYDEYGEEYDEYGDEEGYDEYGGDEYEYSESRRRLQAQRRRLSQRDGAFS